MPIALWHYNSASGGVDSRRLGCHSRTVGGTATPAAFSTAWQTPRRSVRRYSLLPCSSTSTSWRARRSRFMSVHSSPSSTLSKMMFFRCKELERADSSLALQFRIRWRRQSPAGRHSRTVGGTATPAAFSTAWQTPRRSVRRYSLLPCSSTSTSWRARRSRFMSAHSSVCP